MTEQRLPQLAVCSYNEIAAGVSVETIGMLDSASLDARGAHSAIAVAG